ncbi:MAG: ParM/StbA family protein [Pleurocapsa sp. MO_226.B13]|nr:ParM/StbA family protein [Pleurocapsa sp. MO_226.B13]
MIDQTTKSTTQSVSSSGQTKLTTLNLVLDPGTSCTKNIYSKGRRGKPKFLVSSAVVCPTSVEPGLEETYVKLAEDEQYYLVGDSAVQTKIKSSVRQLKSESITVKVLGAVGQIAREESLASNFKLNLALLLPMSEMADQTFVETELIKALTDFTYSGNSYQIEVSSIRFRPEGNGIYTYFTRTVDSDVLRNQTAVYLMFGYRNTSLLLIENGRFNSVNSHSTDLGFYNYLDLVAKYSSGLYRDDIQNAIVTEASYGVGENCQQVIKGFTSSIRIEDLIRSTSKKYQERERASISAAINRADEEYWQLLSSWLREKLPPLGQVDRIIYCGGSISFIDTPVNEFFEGWNGTLLNTNDLGIELLDKLQLPQASKNKFIAQYLPVRLADAWGQFVDLANLKI